MTAFLGSMAAISSLTVIFVGVPRQIYENHRRKSCDGLSFLLILIVTIGYIFWAAYGFSKDDIFLAVSQTPGALFYGVILLQFRVYKNAKVGSSD